MKVNSPKLDNFALFDSKQLDAELCKRSFFYFVQMFIEEVIPEKIVYNWHIEYLCSQLQEIAERVARREAKLEDLIINIPPGTTKSTICTIMLPAWAWVLDPTLRLMTVSYSASLSTDHSVKSRDVIQSAKYQNMFPHIRIKRDQNNKTHYINTLSGERYSTSVTGTATGFHAHIQIVDDPINPKGAKSDAERDEANNFMDQTLSSRKVDKELTPTVLVMQRLHQKDPTGNWLDKKNKPIKHICLPGEISANVKPIELKERYVGGLLDPKRLSRKALDIMSIDLGSYGYAGQVMQVPTPADGGIWQKWIIPITDSLIPNLSEIGTDWDLAYTKDEKNSACAYVTAGKSGNSMYITGLDWAWLEFPELVNWMKTKTFPHHIEQKASGKSAKQTLVRSGIPAIEVPVIGGDKIARTRLATPFAESGMIFCAQSVYDKLHFDDRQGILIFPNGEHNDLNDALVQAITRLLGRNQFFVV